MNKFLIFGLFILLFDIPFVIYVIKPKYNVLNMAVKTNVIFAILAYILMISSWNLIKGDPLKAAEVGLAIYGTYAFTLAAILPGYTPSFALTEVIWGTFLYVICTILTNKIK
jgi:uncharacterized membrane protein